MPVSTGSSLGKAFPAGDRLSSTSSRQLTHSSYKLQQAGPETSFCVSCLYMADGPQGHCKLKDHISCWQFSNFFWISLSIFLTKTMKRKVSLSMTSRGNGEHYQTCGRKSQKRTYEGGLLCLAALADAAARRSNKAWPMLFFDTLDTWRYCIRILHADMMWTWR